MQGTCSVHLKQSKVSTSVTLDNTRGGKQDGKRCIAVTALQQAGSLKTLLKYRHKMSVPAEAKRAEFGGSCRRLCTTV